LAGFTKPIDYLQNKYIGLLRKLTEASLSKLHSYALLQFVNKRVTLNQYIKEKNYATSS